MSLYVIVAGVIVLCLVIGYYYISIEMRATTHVS